MPKLPRPTAAEAETLLLNAGFSLDRSKGSHRIYRRGAERMVIRFHGEKTPHPKIV